MQFRLAGVDDTKEVKALWAYCFEPAEDPFFKYYFTHCYEPLHTMVGVDHGHVLSTVHLRQYRLCTRGIIQPVSYMVGVATHPAARRSGIGGALLKAALEELRRRQQGITILMPSKAAFYQQYGWELYCHQWVQTMPLESLRPLTDRELHFGLITETDQWRLLAPVYERYTRGTSGYAVRGEAEWTRLLESFWAEGVQVAVVYRKEETTSDVDFHRNEPMEDMTVAPMLGEDSIIEGYCVYRLGEREIPVTEMAYTSRQAQKALLNYMYNHRSQGDSIRWNEGLHDEGYRFYPDGKTGHSTMPYMMSRVVDVTCALETMPIACVHGERLQSMSTPWTLGITDPLASWNEGTYEIRVDASSMENAIDKHEGRSYSGSHAQRVATQLRDEHVRAMERDNSPMCESDGHRTYLEGKAMGLTVSKISDTVLPTADVTMTVGALSVLLMGAVSARALAFEGKLYGSDEGISYLDALYPVVPTFINEWW